VTLPPHTRVDASATYELTQPHGTWPGVALTGRIENLLDARYQDIMSFPARGRSLLFGGRLRLGT